MPATLSVTNQPAMFAGRDHTQRMPSSKPSMCMPTTASISETGVLAPVSLFVLVRTLSVLILLVVLLSLSGLTGLVNLVGLKKGLAPGVTQGD
jgi:hypothetical protein